MLIVATLAIMGAGAVRGAETRQRPVVSIDPITRYAHVTYRVPEAAPDEVEVLCSLSLVGQGVWRPAKVRPLISETALGLTPEEESTRWTQQGRLVERRAAGLKRTVVVNPYPQAQQEGRVEVGFKIQIRTLEGEEIATHQVRLEADNSDVVYLEDWTRVFQGDSVVTKTGGEVETDGRRWTYQTELKPEEGASLGNRLHGQSAADVPLPQLTYPLDLTGWYALHVCTPPHYGVDLRLSGDERTDCLGSRYAGEEVLWRWAKMDRQHLVLKQSHAYTGYTHNRLDYVKLVPLTEEQVKELDAQFGEPDKLVAGYWEPYSWAFNENIQETLQHREPLSAFGDARIDIVDTQVGRFGDKVVYESRHSDPLVFDTFGDPIGNVATPKTSNVGRMQQYTNTLDATVRYARELSLRAFANFGASNCYPGTPLQSDFSKEHPEWMRGSCLRFEVAEVRAYAMRLYRECLEIGAPGLSIDYCRYPECVDTAETGNTFMRELRALADEFAQKRGEPVPILTRFPGTGVRRWELFDYKTWAREGLVDYLCPGNLQGRHMHIDIAPYQEAVKGTKCKLLPALDGLSWGLPLPGPFLWRVANLYDAGVEGLYVYQADSRVLGKPTDRRCMRMLASSQAVNRFWEEDRRLRPQRSKGIYVTPQHQVEGYHGWERLRVWTEGIELGEVEMYLDDKLACRADGPPYLLGTEEYESDGVIPPGEHELRIRARDGEGWLEQTFTIKGAP